MTNTNKTVGVTIGQIGLDGKKSIAFAASTVKAYGKLSVQLHQTACVAFYRAAQFGDCDALNVFYAGLRVNDQTALRVWFGAHASYVDLDNATTKNWIKWTKEKGFTIVNGVEAYRKDMFTIDEQEEGKTMLLGLAPFYDKDVKKADALTLEALVNIMARAAAQVNKKATDSGIALPKDIADLVKNVDVVTSNELANIKRVAALNPAA